MISAADLLALADMLLSGTTEAEWRSAISRAYFAVFHQARQSFRQAGFSVPRGEQAHAYLWYRLSNCSDPQTQSAGALLNDLRRNRNFSDYDIERTLKRAEAVSQMQRAKEIVALLKVAFAEPLRAQIIEEMKVYERDALKEVTWKPITP
jgi:uncharacterized protein (UPF0332 family)